MKGINITEVHLTAGSPAGAESGLLGWVSATLNGRIRLDGLALRRTADGRHTLSFPARRDSTGRHHHYIRPLDDAARRDIENQVFTALHLQEHAAR